MEHPIRSLIEETAKVISETDRRGDIEFAKYGTQAAPTRSSVSSVLPAKIDANFFKLFGAKTGANMGQVRFIGVRLSESMGKKPEMMFFNDNFQPASYSSSIKDKGFRTLVIAEDGRMGEMKEGKFVSLVSEGFNIQSKRTLVDSIHSRLKSEKGIDPRHVSAIYFFLSND